MSWQVQREGKLKAAAEAVPINDLYEKLKTAAEAGKVDDLYDVIQHEPGILERMDRVPFAHTPLHIAASKGQMDFAMEMMNLKSSFSRKLNPCGFTPLHLAVQNEHNLKMVMWLLDVDNTLARIKGRGGKTPLHLAAEQGNVDTLTEFFEACPESIKDVTIQGDTALHLALKERKEAAFILLFGWLDRSVFPHAEFWEREIINWKNKEGNTILHIAAEHHLDEVVKWLIARGARTNVGNSQGRTAIDILKAHTIRIETRVESRIGRLFFGQIPNSRAKTLDPVFIFSCCLFSRRFSDIPDATSLFARRLRSTMMSSEFRSAMSVVDALIGTITYQAAMNPPGGVWQGSADINSPVGNIIGHDKASNPTTTATEATASHYVGTTVMSTPIFSLFWVTNTVFFLAAVLRLTTSVPHTSMFTFGILIWFVACYFLSMSVTSPSTAWSNFNLILLVFLGLVYLPWLVYGFWSGFSRVVYEPKEERRRSRKGPGSREEWWQ